jgi:threonine efflux protein
MTGYLPALVGVTVVHLVATAIPGPNTLLVMRAAMTKSRGDGVAVTAGIAVSDIVWAVTAVVGLAALFSHVTWLTTTLQILGGLYLVYLGVRTWHAARRPAAPPHNLERGSFVTGVVTNVTNPKSAIFFGSVFATTLPAGAPTWVWLSVVGIIGANAIWFHYLLAVLFSLAPARRAYGQAKAWCDRVLGCLLSLFGAYFVVVAPS